jgi:hypothetical protein
MDGELAVVAVEEDQVEVEAHGEGVDAGAARDQQTGAGLRPAQPGESEQTAVESGCDRDDVAVDFAPGQRFEAVGFAIGAHGPVKSRRVRFSPPSYY